MHVLLSLPLLITGFENFVLNNRVFFRSHSKPLDFVQGIVELD